MYPQREPYTRLLLGSRYVQLRSEFLEWRGWKREIPAVARKVLVTLGGGDPDNVTGQVVQALVPLRDIEAVVVAGGNNPNIKALRSAVAPLSSFVRLAVNAPNMPELMAWADVAVTAAGSTSWELAFMGLPAFFIPLAAHQEAIVDGLVKRGAARSFGAPADLSPARIGEQLAELACSQEARATLARLAHGLVDGSGPSRVAATLKNGANDAPREHGE
jgi:spore coat polysaccharide biosynthesis predicted glycosyltransferase SpsG